MKNDELLSELLAVRDRYGDLTPENVVRAAKAKRHPLHDRFEWDDSEAGKLYRREQAHKMIQSVRVVHREPTGERKSVRAFVAVPRAATRKPTYEPAAALPVTELQRKLTIQQATREWQTLKTKYAGLPEFLDMVREDLGTRRPQARRKSA